MQNKALFRALGVALLLLGLLFIANSKAAITAAVGLPIFHKFSSAVGVALIGFGILLLFDSISCDGAVVPIKIPLRFY